MPETVELIIRGRNELSPALRSATADLERLARAPAAVAGGFLRLGSQLGMTVFGLQQLGRTVTGIGSGLFSFNARMEQTAVAFTTLLGSAQRANQILGELQQFAARTPFEFPELAQSVRLMSAFGFEAERLIPTLQSVGDAVSALGGGSFELNRVVVALGQMQAKGRVSAEEMLQLTEVGIPAWDILAEKIGKSTSEVQKMTERGLIPANQAIDMLVEGMGERFAGAMEAQSRTFTGLMSTLRDNVNMALGRIMAPAFEVAKDNLEDLVAFLNSPEFDAWADEMAEGAEELAQQVGTFLRNEGPNLLRLAGDLTTAGLNLATAVGSLADEVSALNDALGGHGIEALLAVLAVQKVTGGITGQVARGIATGGSQALFSRLLGGGAGAAAGGALAGAATGAIGAAAVPVVVVGGIAAGAAAVGTVGRSNVELREQLQDRELSPMERYAFTRAGVLPGTAQTDRARAIEAAAAIDQQTEAVQRQTAAIGDGAAAWQYWRDVQDNTVNVIQEANAETLLQIEYFSDLQRAVDSVALAQGSLARAYQEAGQVQDLFNKQGNEYRSNLSAVEDAIAAIQEKQRQGIPLTQQEAALLANQSEILGRLRGGMQDATIQAGLMAAAQTELMLAQDELNRLQQQGITSGAEYEAALQRVQEAQANYNALLPPGAQMLGEMQQVNSELSRVLHEELVPALQDLKNNLDLLPKDPIAIQIQLTTEIAERQLEDLKTKIRSGAVLPVSISGPGAGGVGPGAGMFQHGGVVPRTMLALVGEAGPELVVLPAGAEVIPAHRTQALLSSLPFAGAFQSGGVVGAGLPSTEIQVTLASITAAIPALSEEQAEQVKRASDTYASAIRTLTDAMELARALPQGTITVPEGMLSGLAGLARQALDAVRAADPGLAEEAAEQLRRFAGAAGDALQVIGETARLVDDLAAMPEVGDRAAIEERISQLKFLTEHLAVSLGDSAAAVQSARSGAFLAALETFARSAGPAIQAIGQMAEVTGSLLDLPGIEDDRLQQRITDLKLLIEHLALSLGDTAEAVTAARSREFAESLQSFSQAVGPAIRAVGDTLDLATSLSDAVLLDPDTLSERVGQVGDVLAAVAQGMSEQAAGLSSEQVEALSAFAEAAQGAIRAEIEAVNLLGSLAEMPNLNLERISQRTGLLAQTIELVATDLSAATDRLLQQQPEIVERLTTFNEGIAPALSGIQGIVQTFSALREQGRLTERQAQRFSDNLTVAVGAISSSIGALEELEASGDLATFERVISRIARAFELAFGVFGQGTGRSRAGSGGAGEPWSGGRREAPIYVNVQLDGETIRRTVTDAIAGQVRTVR